MKTSFSLLLAASAVMSACGPKDKLDQTKRDSAAADTARISAARDTVPAPRVVPYNPSAPGAMRSGDAPIRATPATVQPPRQSPSPAVAVDSVGDPVAIVRDYYAAIRAHDFLRAYRMWETSGQRNVRSYAQFAAGFDSTESVEAKIGAPGRVEGAAGSRFVTVPVDIDSRLRSGTRQRFTGTYTLRRVEVPGASAAQRRWHLYAASIRQVQ